MRGILAILIVIGVPAIAAAQSTSTTASPTVPPLPPIGLPLPQIGLPLTPLGLPPETDTKQRPDATPTLSRPEPQARNNSRRPGPGFPSVVYVIPPFGWPDYYSTTPFSMRFGIPATEPTAPREPAREPANALGRLRLDLQADTTPQIYVDGYYVGTTADFNEVLELEAGPHEVEVRAAGYEDLAFDVRIAANRTITYEAALKPLQPPARKSAPPENEPPSQPAPTGPATIYFIPGCYLGNVPPQTISLPATCDLRKLIVRQP